jgi:hypothetical protein
MMSSTDGFSKTTKVVLGETDLCTKGDYIGNVDMSDVIEFCVGVRVGLHYLCASHKGCKL